MTYYEWHSYIFLLSNSVAFLAPVPKPAIVEVIVGNDAVLSVADDNPSPQMTSFEWRNPDGVVVSVFRVYQILDVTEADAGVYTCTITSGLTNEMLSAEVTLVVQCKGPSYRGARGLAGGGGGGGVRRGRIEK